MQGNVWQLLNFLHMGRTLTIPVYQRNYSCHPENCRQLERDLVKVIQNNQHHHFLGSIVAMNDSHGGVGEYLIIDGQQRITTVSLLLKALCCLLKEGKIQSRNANLADMIQESYLIFDRFNPHIEDVLRLRLNDHDRNAYEHLFNGLEQVKGARITENYEGFCEWILRGELTPDEIFEALGRLEVISIVLNRESGDDPQLIFESLNSTGLALSEGDKIRNFILMGLPLCEQELYYKKYWAEIERCVGDDVSLFMRDWLSLKTLHIPSIGRVYFAFKDFAEGEKLQVEDLLKNLLSYAKLYGILLHGQIENRALRGCIFRLNFLETSVTRPYFMEVLRLHKEKQLDDETVAEIFRIIESFVFRRSVCRVATNALSKLFVTLFRDVEKVQGSTEDYCERLKYVLNNKKESSRFPDDEEFMREFTTRDMYHVSTRTRVYLLERLENAGTLEDKDVYGHIEAGDYSIEHVMPQTLNNGWVRALGEDYRRIHDTWCDRVANLTLTAYNSTYSNRPFEEKRDMEKGFKNSGIRLNSWIAQQDCWGENELQERAENLKETALRIWPKEESGLVISARTDEGYSLDDEGWSWRSRKIMAFSFRGQRESVKSWTEMYTRVMEYVYAEDRVILRQEVAKDITVRCGGRCLSAEESELREGHKLDEGLGIEKNTDTHYKLKILKAVFDLYEISAGELMFYLREEKENDK